MIDVVALGELLIDFTMAGEDADGYPTIAAHPGGAPASLSTTRAGGISSVPEMKDVLERLN